MTKLLIAAIASTTAVFAQVAPLIDCVEYDRQSNILTAHWSYVNTATSTVTLLPGPQNFLDPPPGFQGQPLKYTPGTFLNVFTTTLDLSLFSTQTWNLDGMKAAASNDPKLYCSSAGVACWDTNANAKCDASEDSNGDGKCDVLDCVGRPGAAGPAGATGPQGPAGAQGPAGPPGLSPATRVVTVASSTNAATAACNATEALVNGGGLCTVPNTNTISGRIASSAPSGSNWAVSCSTGQATAVALCAAKQQ